MSHDDGHAILSWLPAGTSLRPGNRWLPATGPSGARILFNGWFDNADEIAAQLGMPGDDVAALYGAAVDRWGDEAERRIIGEYCTILAAPEGRWLRLARSPIHAPPLHYFINELGMGAASVPRALHAMGMEPRLSLRKLADNLYFNLTEEEGFFESSFRVSTGQIVYLQNGQRRTVKSFDPLSIKPMARIDPRECVEEVDRLLEQAAKACLAGAKTPAIQLSGGLDSSNVAARALRCLPDGKRLKSFTFTPLPAWPDTETDRYYSNERPKVEAFAAMHPQLEPHFSAGDDREFDEDFEKLFLAMGTGQASMAILQNYHGIYREAQRQGCDVMLSSDLGNATFSQSGDWAYAEYFRTGRWRQLRRALGSRRRGETPWLQMAIGLCVLGSLPWPLWKAWQALLGKSTEPVNIAVAHLLPQAIEAHDCARRAERAGVSFVERHYGYRQDLIRDQYCRGDIESADVLQGMEQLYGIRTRDVPAWRPLVEFCLSLPTDMFMRDGQDRWLARELSRGIMPEEQRVDRRFGFQGADWYLRLTPHKERIRRELASARSIPELASLLDFERLERLLDDWPEQAPEDPELAVTYAYALPRVLSTARYVRFMKGTNA